MRQGVESPGNVGSGGHRSVEIRYLRPAFVPALSCPYRGAGLAKALNPETGGKGKREVINSKARQRVPRCRG